jgi:hypothetical protein
MGKYRVMDQVKLARIGIIVSPNDPYGTWFNEAIDHVGLIHEKLPEIPYAKIDDYDVLVLCGRGSVADSTLLHLWLKGNSERAIVVCGDPWGLSEFLGIRVGGPMGESWIEPSDQDPFPIGASAFRTFGGTRAMAFNAKVLLTSRTGAISVSKKDRAFFLAPHIGQTLSFYLMGRSVEVDEIGAADGTAVYDVGPLRSEYGSRIPFEEREMGMFTIPHADCARELFLRTILQAVETCNKQAMIAWHLPRGSEFGAIITIEADTQNPTDAYNLNANLSMSGTRATIFTRFANYPPDVYTALRRGWHEIGFNYDPNDTGGWHPEQFRIEVTSLGRLIGNPKVPSLRFIGNAWKGWHQPYTLAHFGGAKTMVSKGGIEPGSSGFTFGTCHPFVPRGRDGLGMHVYEFPFHAYNSGVTTPAKGLDRILPEVIARHGFIHGVFKVSTVSTEIGVSAMRRWISIIRQAGADFYTLERLSTFEEARRGLKLRFENGDTVHMVSESDLDGLTLIVTGTGFEASGVVGRTAPQTVRRYGRDCVAFTLNLQGRKLSVLRLQGESPAQAA